MNRQPDLFLEALYEACEQKHHFSARNKTEHQTWQCELRQAFSAALGLDGFPEIDDPPSETLLEEVSCDGYTRLRVSLNLCPTLSAPVYLLLPEGASRPWAAVIACHGHGYGSRDLVGLMPDGLTPKAEPGYQQNFAVELARLGYFVVAPDLLGFGDMRLREDEKNEMEKSSCQRMAANLLMTGQTLAGARVFQIRRILDWLCQQEAVDASRIGCMGISGGGLVCAFTSALDDRIKAAVVSCYANTFKDSVMAMDHCIDNFVPSILHEAEMPDLIGLVAPRPLFIESGQKDPIFPVAATQKAISQIALIYQVLDASFCFDSEIFPGGHQIWGKKAYPWLQRHLPV